jgi:methylthioxylose transferase
VQLSHSRRAPVRLPAPPARAWLGAAIAAGTLLAAALIDRDLGLRYPPFVGNYAPRVSLWMLLAIPAFAAAVALVPRALNSRPASFALSLYAGTLVLRLLLAAARGGTEQWAHVFRMTSFEGPNEYLPALTSFTYGTGFFLDRFAQLVPSLPVHSAGHPPGLLLVMHALALDTPARLAAFCIAIGALSAPLTYALGRQVLSERDARVAGGLMALAPGALLFGATSADAVYCTLGLLAAIPLAANRPLLGGAILGVVTLFAWSLLGVLAWAAILVLARDGLKPALRLATLAAAAAVGVIAAFSLATGFDPLGTLHATSRVYELGIAARRPYAFWLFGSPVAFLLVLGLPIAWLALKADTPAALAIAAVIAVSAIAGFTKAETERIWLFLAPLVCLAAAPLVRRHRTLAAILAAQALIYGALMDTVW